METEHSLGSLGMPPKYSISEGIETVFSYSNVGETDNNLIIILEYRLLKNFSF